MAVKKRPLIMIIINYNDFLTTQRLIDNVKDYKSLKQILIVDNHSTDTSYQQLKKLENQKIKVIQTTQNKGFAAGLNFGAKHAIQEFKTCDLIFSNADIIIYSDENLKSLQEGLHTSKIGMLGPSICEHNSLNRGWKIPTPKQEILINLPWLGKKFKKKYQLYKENDYQGKITNVEAVSGCFFLMPSNVLEEVNYFDEQTFLYYEENIMAKKLIEKGYRVAVYNDVAIIHDHSVSIDKNISYLHKFKILKTSQYYFEKEYNNANKLELFFLKLTSNITLVTLYIRIFFKGGFRK